MVDCHIHSQFSPDSEINLEKLIKIAIQKKLSGIIITDHFEYNFPNKNYNFDLDYINREKVISKLKKNNNNLKILSGVEFGLQKKYLDQLKEKINNFNNFDFILLSLHAIDGQDIALPKFFKNKTINQIWEKYLSEILYLIKNFNNYDSIAHIGYIKRYSNQNSFDFFNSKEILILEEIFKHVIKNNKGIEINTSGYRYNLNNPIPDYNTLKLYKDLGGQILTIGSDSHKYEHTANFFDITKKELKKIGFNHLTYFENRKPIFYKI